MRDWVSLVKEDQCLDPRSQTRRNHVALGLVQGDSTKLAGKRKSHHATLQSTRRDWQAARWQIKEGRRDLHGFGCADSDDAEADVDGLAGGFDHLQAGGHGAGFLAEHAVGGDPGVDLAG